MAVSFIGGGNQVPRENHQPAASHWQILSHNVVSSTPCLEWDSKTHKMSSNRHKKLWIKMLKWKWCWVNMIFNKNNIRINRISCGNIIIYLKPYLIYVSQGWFQLENKITEITENQLKSSTPPFKMVCFWPFLTLSCSWNQLNKGKKSSLI
jgi:hypothetical protein